MSATIVQFVPRDAATDTQRTIIRASDLDADIANTGRTANARGECKERERRQDAWRVAERSREFYTALARLGHAAYCAVKWAGLREARPYADDDNQRTEVGDRLREAIRVNLLTPAPTVAALNWKKGMARKKARHIPDGTREAVERSIASDEAWLKANAPVRHKAVRS